MTDARSREVADRIATLRGLLAEPNIRLLMHDPDIVRLIAHLDRVSLAWPFELTPAVSPEDRRGALFAGPLITSEYFPWPIQDDRWLEPVLQIDLAELMRLKSLPLGSGWLQVWAADQGAITRIVPLDDMARSVLAPLPSGDPARYHRNRVASPDDSDIIPWLSGQRITGFGEPFLDYGHNDLTTLLDWSTFDEFPQDLQRQHADLKATLADPDWYPLVARAFGMVNESDVAAYQYPRVLIVLEEGAPLLDSWNGADGAYVCYESNAVGDLTLSVFGPHL